MTFPLNTKVIGKVELSNNRQYFLEILVSSSTKSTKQGHLGRVCGFDYNCYVSFISKSVKLTVITGNVIVLCGFM